MIIIYASLTENTSGIMLRIIGPFKIIQKQSNGQNDRIICMGLLTIPPPNNSVFERKESPYISRTEISHQERVFSEKDSLCPTIFFKIYLYSFAPCNESYFYFLLIKNPTQVT